MYFAYLDETGISKKIDEPWVLVAGVVVRDNQWKSLEKRLLILADEYAPDGKPAKFFFHAKELINGGRIIDRQTYPLARRLDAIEQICLLISEYQLPVIQGAVHRASYNEMHAHALKDSNVLLDAQLIAFTSCAVAIDVLMRDFPDDEIATITVEKGNQCIGDFRKLQKAMKSPDFLKGLDPRAKAFWPLERIVDSVNECEKGDSSLLQLADIVAYVLKRHLMGDYRVARFMNVLPSITGFTPEISSSYAN